MLSVVAGSITCLAYGIAALVLSLRGRRSVPNFLLAAAAALTAAWAAVFAASVAGQMATAQPLGVAQAARDLAWFAVIIAFLRQDAVQQRLWRSLSAVALMAALAELAFVFLRTNIDTGVGIRLNLPVAEFAASVVGLILVENLVRNLPGPRAWSLKLLAIGLAALFGYDVALRIPELLGGSAGMTYFAAAQPLVYLVVLPLFVVTAVRNDSLKLQLHSSRNVVFHSTTVLFAGILLQGTAAAAYYVRSFGGTPAVVLAIVFGFTAVVGITVALSSHSARSRLRVFINENFYSYKYDYRLEWKKFINTLAGDENTTGPERVLRTLTNLLDSPGGILWVRREGWRQFVPLAHWSLTEKFGPIDATDDLLESFANKDVVYVELSADPLAADTARWRQRFPNAWLAIPVRFRERLVAVALLQKPRAARQLDWEDRNLLGLTALELGAHLVHEQMAQTLADTQQLAEFNKRVTFAVHDLKNTAGQLTLLVRNAERFGDDPEFRADMITTITHAASNLQQLIEKLRVSGPSDATQKQADTKIDLREMVTRVATGPVKSKITVEAASRERPFYAVVKEPAALESALAHVVANALEASPAEANVRLSMAQAQGCIRLQVADQGPGMSEDFIAHELFRPLHTTKKSGLGVGAYQARTILRELGGDIEVESKVGEGTVVTLVVPAPPSEQQSMS